jgi:hypothetical protein
LEEVVPLELEAMDPLVAQPMPVLPVELEEPLPPGQPPVLNVPVSGPEIE